ncbi:MAG: hypothetical protein IAF02_14300 [Anaerolineae bacterium]|nr:hypothetical protein [Anaerolineae bacterium]
MSAARQKRYRLRKKLNSLYRESFAYTLIVEELNAEREHNTITAAIESLSYEEPDKAITTLVNILIRVSIVTFTLNTINELHVNNTPNHPKENT